MKPGVAIRTLRLTGVKWRCCLCPAEGIGRNENEAWLRFDEHYLKVHYEKPEASR